MRRVTTAACVMMTAMACGGGGGAGGVDAGTSDAAGNPDAPTAIADASAPDAPTGPDPQIVSRYDFESPAITGTSGPVPPGLGVFGLASVVKPDLTGVDPALQLGSQMLRVEGSTSLLLDNLAIAQPGEEWELSLVVGVPNEATMPGMEAGLFGEHAAMAYIDTDPPNGLPGIHQFKAMSVRGHNDGPEPRVLHIQIDLNGPMLIDNLQVRRTAIGGVPTPYAPRLWNASFEQAGLASEGFSTTIAGWTSAGTFAAVYSPSAPARWGARPYVAPGDGTGMLELGSTSTAASASSAQSDRFAFAELGRTYGFTFGVGHRLDLPACRDNRIAIMAGTTELVSLSVADTQLPAGAFVEQTLTTPVIDAATAGQALTIKVDVADSQVGLAAPCRTDIDAFVAIP